MIGTTFFVDAAQKKLDRRSGKTSHTRGRLRRKSGLCLSERSFLKACEETSLAFSSEDQLYGKAREQWTNALYKGVNFDAAGQDQIHRVNLQAGRKTKARRRDLRPIAMNEDKSIRNRSAQKVTEWQCEAEQRSSTPNKLEQVTKVSKNP